MTAPLTAKTADKYVLYQRAVQSAETDVEFLIKTYKKLRNKKAKHFREDFCGTCLLSANWIQQGRCAQNFSYWIFKTRSEMLDYFKGVREDLAEDGIFIIDLHGGPESHQELEEETEMADESFTYVWDQDSINPITGDARFHIHFRFPDGSEMTNAFSYDWRLWGLTELRDIMIDAGFSAADCYWEGTDDDGETGDGEFTKTVNGEACLSYIAYLVAQK